MDDDPGPKGPRRRKLAKIGADIKRGMNRELYKHDNPWVHHVKMFAEKNNLAYGCALSDPKIKEGYIPGKYTRSHNIPKVHRCNSPERKERSHSPKRKHRKEKKDESKEAEKHLKFLNKISGGSYEARQAERKKGGGAFSTDFLNKLESRVKGAEYGKKYKVIKELVGKD